MLGLRLILTIAPDAQGSPTSKESEALEANIFQNSKKAERKKESIRKQVSRSCRRFGIPAT